MNSVPVLVLLGLFAFGSIWALLIVLSADVAKDMVVTEARTRLERLPFVLLRLARRRLPADYRSSVHDNEWLPELHFVVRGTDGLPLTRLARGLAFALGLVLAAPKIARELGGGPTMAVPDPARLGHRPSPLRLGLIGATVFAVNLGMPAAVTGIALISGVNLTSVVVSIGFVLLGTWALVSSAIVVRDIRNDPSLWPIELDLPSANFTSMWSPSWSDDDQRPR